MNCIYCREMETIDGAVFCSQECKQEYDKEMPHPFWESEIIYDEAQEDIYKKIRSLSYED